MKQRVTAAAVDAFLGARPKFYKGRHIKKCQCNLCVRERLAQYETRARMAMAGGARIGHASQTIPVRSHFRANPNHLNGDDALRALVREVVAEILREQKRRVS